MRVRPIVATNRLVWISMATITLKCIFVEYARLSEWTDCDETPKSRQPVHPSLAALVPSAALGRTLTSYSWRAGLIALVTLPTRFSRSDAPVVR